MVTEASDAFGVDGVGGVARIEGATEVAGGGGGGLFSIGSANFLEGHVT